jgi:hypothetical protein
MVLRFKRYGVTYIVQMERVESKRRKSSKWYLYKKILKFTKFYDILKEIYIVKWVIF